MNLHEAQIGLARLKAAYPSSKPFDDIANELFLETLMRIDTRDFQASFSDMTGTLTFFPSIAEITEAVNFCRSRRLAFEDSQARRSRLALNAVMDPKAPLHSTVAGPNHARFLRLLKGEESFPAPEWKRKSSTSNPAA